MSLQMGIHNRRKFLERSALGAGSVLFLPGLLASCKDHDVSPTNPPLLGDDIDWNNDAKTAVGTGLGLIPEVGGILNALVNVFWPSSNDVWQQVKLIDQEISTQVYSLVSDALGSLTPTPTGLISYLQTYHDELQNGQPSDIKEAWVNAKDAFAGAQGYFQDKSNQVQLLPLFAQFANLYLALLRDGVVSGLSWGRTTDEHNNIDVPALKNAISAFITYTADTYNNIGRVNVVKNAGSAADNWQQREPFKSVNSYDRQMTMLVLDYMDTWPYYDVTKYPNGAKNPDGTKIYLFTREIYSDPYGKVAVIPGTPSPVPAIVLPSPATQFPTQITIWGGDRIDAVQLTYPAGGGPNGVTTTPRMGDSGGGSNQPPHGGTLNLTPDMPIIRALVTTDEPGGSFGDEFISTIQFILSNGNGNTNSPQYGGGQGPSKSGTIGYDYYALSSIYIHGPNVNLPNTSADCIVFGFMRWPRQ
jgi:hypothetical protein